jgi:DNA-binding MurR/RpiR family transcriptional regulator
VSSAARRKVTTVLITDSGTPLIGTEDSTLQVAVPSKGLGCFPSLVAALSLVQAIVVELSEVEPESTRASLVDAERKWRNSDFSAVTRADFRRDQVQG